MSSNDPGPIREKRSDELTDELIGVVVVAFNSAATLLVCVDSCLADPKVAVVMIIDNSADALSSSIITKRAESDGRLRYHAPEHNIGFARGCNLGAAKVGEVAYLAFVNPDVFLTRHLSELTVRLVAGPQVVVAGLLVNNGRQRSINARPRVTAARELVKCIVGSRAYAMRVEDDVEQLEVDQLDGALLVMASRTFDLLGGFDEQFELYYEDVDICSRARLLGGCLLIAEPWGKHYGGVSSASTSGASYCVSRISRVRYLKKISRHGAAAGLALIGMAIVELVTRTVTNRPEGLTIRLRAVVLQVKECCAPASVTLLQQRNTRRALPL